MKDAALRAASTQGGGRLRRPPSCVDSFMDGCVAVAEPEAVAVCTMHIFPVCTMLLLVLNGLFEKFLKNNTLFSRGPGFPDFTSFYEPGQPSGGNSF